MTLLAPAPTAVPDVATAARAIRAAALAAAPAGTEAPCTVGTVGLELEVLLVDPAAPGEPVRIERTRSVLAPLLPLPGGSRVTYEPGGQLELSTPPCRDLDTCSQLLERDLAVAGTALRGAGLLMLASGADPARPARRVLDEPRYAAMQAYFDAGWPAGRSMMCSTAALQVNLEAGGAGSGPQSAAARWRRVHAVGPVLLAMFANSPRLHGRVTGYPSSRARVWSRIDRRRTRPVGGSEPAAAWASYALRAGVMFARQPDGRCLPVPAGTTLGDWAGGRTALRPLDAGDVAYHLTTLFPPVRPRGFLELRFLDTLPAPWWQAAAAVTAAVLDDSETGLVAERVCEPVPSWSRAVTRGLRDPALAAAAAAIVRAAPAALPRIGAARLDGAVAAFADRYTLRGRCPADDALELRVDLAPDLQGGHP